MLRKLLAAIMVASSVVSLSIIIYSYSATSPIGVRVTGTPQYYETSDNSWYVEYVADPVTAKQPYQQLRWYSGERNHLVLISDNKNAPMHLFGGAGQVVFVRVVVTDRNGKKFATDFNFKVPAAPPTS